MDMADAVEISLIVPAYNEEACIEATLVEARAELAKLAHRFEIIAVNDGSSDGTRSVLLRLRKRMPELRVISLKPNSGQSAALGAGFKLSRGRILVLMDADGQNDPADIPRLLDGLATHDVCCGYRAVRRDTAAKIIGSRIANRIRNWALREDIVDTGCTLKALKAHAVKDFSMWRGMHRFLPALARMNGATIGQIPVNHRPRAAGQSKYTNLARLRETFWDLWAVRWMQKRHRRFEVEVEP